MRTEFRLRHHSRWCPCCIRENCGRWMLRWRLAWSYACLIHEVFLAFRCPSPPPQARQVCTTTLPSSTEAQRWTPLC
ncbi:TniQ family protein [Streptomyces beijiangensis]|uniref:TniQ family protein n=1 Tax=Streptomyces beijiangensis TaxID=163361 RepID=UPI0031E443AB